jgi:predicted transcriptional regulator
MSNAAIISIKPEFCNQIISKKKTIELRRSTMGLNRGDVVLVYSSLPDQCLKFWFRIKRVEICDVKDMWDSYQHVLGIDPKRYFEYFEETRLAIGIHIGRVCILQPAIKLETLRRLAPDFAPPQGIIWIENKTERFKNLVEAIRPPIPKDVFRQMSLFIQSEKDKSPYVMK